MSVVLASSDEQEIFDAMLAEALEDEFTAATVELFALEAIACTRRAGYEAELVRFDPLNGDATFSIPGDAPDPGPEAAAWNACAATFYYAALDEFDRNRVASVQETDAEELARREKAALDCFSSAGYEFTDVWEALDSSDVSTDVSMECTAAYIE